MEKFYTFLLSTIVFFSISCQNDQETYVIDPSQAITREYIYSLLALQNVNYRIVIEPDQAYVLKFSDDEILYIPENSLIGPDGNSVIGSIKIEYNPIESDKAAFIISPSTIYQKSLSKQLVSFDIKISQNNNLLTIVKPLQFYRSVSSPDVDLTQVTNKNDTWSATSQVLEVKKWIITNGENQLNVFGVKMNINNLEISQGILAVDDKLPINEITTSLCVTYNQKLTNTNTLAVFRSLDGKVVLRLQPQGNSFCSRSINMTSPSIEGNIIVISDFGNEDYQFGTIPAVLGSNNRNQIEVQKSTIKEIKAAIEKL